MGRSTCDAIRGAGPAPAGIPSGAGLRYCHLRRQRERSCSPGGRTRCCICCPRMAKRWCAGGWPREGHCGKCPSVAPGLRRPAVASRNPRELRDTRASLNMSDAASSPSPFLTSPLPSPLPHAGNTCRRSTLVPPAVLPAWLAQRQHCGGRGALQQRPPSSCSWPATGGHLAWPGLLLGQMQMQMQMQPH